MVTTRSCSRIPKTPKSNSKCIFDFKLSTGALSEPRSAASAALTPITLKSVTLQDWWLVKTAEGKGLGVGGLVSREKLGVRTFCSAAIAKRHSATTLETTDGVTITISCCINRSRTHQNGFPLEVCNHFLIGFPYYWDQYNGEAFPKRSNPTDDPNFLVDSDVHSGCSSEDSLDDIPVTKMRDILMSPRGDPERCSLINVISEKLSSKQSENASTKSSEPVNPNTDNSSPDKTSNGKPKGVMEIPEMCTVRRSHRVKRLKYETLVNM